jgi:hypothetical protein
VIAYSNLQI